MRVGASGRNRVSFGNKILMLIILAAVLAVSASAASTEVHVVSPYLAEISTDMEVPAWGGSGVIADSGTGVPKDFLIQITNNYPYAGDVLLELEINGSMTALSCDDFSDASSIVITPLLGSAALAKSSCSVKDGNVLILFSGYDDSINPSEYSFSMTFPSSEGESYTITPNIKQAALSTSSPIIMFGGESRSVAHFSGCAYIEVWVTGTLPITLGDYNLSDSSLAACKQYAVDRWNCTATSEYDLWMSAKIGTLNNYTLSPYCAPIGGSGGGGTIIVQPIEVCESHWTACIDGLSYRYCMKGSINTTRIKNCTTNVTCTPDWFCSDWGVCRETGVQLRTCTDLNECNLPLTRPAVSQSCNYTDGSGSGNETDDDDDDDNGGGNSGGGSGGGGSGGGSSKKNDSNADEGYGGYGWTCDPYGPCVNGRHSAFCYKDTRDSNLNFTVTEDCVEDLMNETEPDVVIVTGGEDNETEPDEITGNVAVEPDGGRNLWPLWLLLLLLALLIGGYLLGKKKGWFIPVGKKRKKAKK